MREQRLTLDRFEGALAICISESEDVIELPREKFIGIKDGDLVLCFFDDDGSLDHVSALTDETARIKKENSDRLQSLFKRSKK